MACVERHLDEAVVAHGRVRDLVTSSIFCDGMGSRVVIVGISMVKSGSGSDGA
jgi:hypothetical protein